MGQLTLINQLIMMPQSNLVTGALVTAAATGTFFFLYYFYKGDKIENPNVEADKKQKGVDEDNKIEVSDDEEHTREDANEKQKISSNESLVEWIDRQLREADERKKNKEDKNN